MRDDFEFYGKGAFSIAPEHSQQDAVFYTDQMTVAPLSRDSLDRQAWKPTWQESGWLLHNPLVRPLYILELEKKRKSYAARRDNGNAHGGLNVTRGR